MALQAHDKNIGPSNKLRLSPGKYVRPRNKIRLTGEDITIDAIVTVCLIFVFFATAYPFYYCLVISFNNGLDTQVGGVYFFPRMFTLQNYKSFFSDAKWLNAFFISVTRTLAGSAVTVLFTVIVAYGLSYPGLKFRKIYMAVIIFSMYFSGGLIPYYITLRNLGLINNYLVYIIPTAFNLFFTLIAISFFEALPNELRESGMLDGATDLTILLRIIMPVSTPLLATMTLFVAVGQWNAWFDSAFFIRQDELKTLGYRLMEVINQAVVPTGQESAQRMTASARVTPLSVRVAAMMVAVLPILCVYPFLQRYFISGLTIGSVKG